MAYQVLHTVKCNKTACKGTEIHNERKETGKDKDKSESQYQSHTNENIDPDRTWRNVALVGDKRSNYYQIAKERITAVRGGVAPNECSRDADGKIVTAKLRKDAVWTCDTVISASPEFFAERYKWDKDKPAQADYDGMNQYFKDAVEFMQNKYGKDNVIGAIVHYDETTPHLHVHWTPITEGKLSYKALSSPTQLKALQTEFNEFLRGKGYELERGEIDSKKKHLNQQMEKLNMAIKENDRKLAELERTDAEYQIAKEGSHKLPNLDPTKAKAKDIQAQNEALRRANADLRSRLASAEQKLARIERANAEYESKERRYYAPMERAYLDFADKHGVYADYLAKHPEAYEKMMPFEREFSSIRKFGEDMKDHKLCYVACCERIHELDQASARASADSGTLRATLHSLDRSEEQLRTLYSTRNAKMDELDALQGKMFKGKEKKALESQISGLQGDIDRLEQTLKGEHGMTDFSRAGFERAKGRVQEALNGLSEDAKSYERSREELTAERDEHQREYKYMAVRAKSFRKEWQDTIGRIEKDYEPPQQHVRAFNIERLTEKERKYIKERLEKDGLGEKSKARAFVEAQEPKLRRSTSQSRGNPFERDEPVPTTGRSR